MCSHKVLVMKPKSSQSTSQLNLVRKNLIEQLNPQHPFLQLAKRIPWRELEIKFAKYYAEKGRPAKPVRLLVGLLLLKQLENLSDERLMDAWIQNPYYQAFCGYDEFQWRFPCNPSDIAHFRKRIGEEGAEEILKMSIHLHGENIHEDECIIDTTVQEKNITFPTDTKLRLKAISHIWNWGKTENVHFRQTYCRKLKHLKRIVRFDKSKQNTAKVEQAKVEIKDIANHLLNEFVHKLPSERMAAYKDKIEIYERAINQEKNSKNKIYSLHEPEVVCICKGKDHKKYEFGSKVAFAITKNSGIVVAAKNFNKNIYDGYTISQTLDQIHSLIGAKIKRLFGDRGFRGITSIGNTKIEIPDSPTPKTTRYAKEKAKKNFGRRCAIEPIIGHIKQDFRMARNFLKGVVGDGINALLAASAFNLRKWIRKMAERPGFIFFYLLFEYIVTRILSPYKVKRGDIIV